MRAQGGELGEQRRVVHGNPHLLAQHAHVDPGQDAREIGIVDAEALREGGEAQLGGNLAVQRIVRVAEGEVDLGERLGEGIERDREPCPGRLVQRGRRGRERFPWSTCARKILVLEIDQGVEEVEDDGADLHPRTLASLPGANSPCRNQPANRAASRRPPRAPPTPARCSRRCWPGSTRAAWARASRFGSRTSIRSAAVPSTRRTCSRRSPGSVSTGTRPRSRAITAPASRRRWTASPSRGSCTPAHAAAPEVRRAGQRAADGSWRYPGTCWARALPRGGWRESNDTLRMRLAPGRVAPRDEGGLDLAQDPSLELGDPVLRRRDGSVAYHLAVVVDDAAQEVTRVVRGRDLAACTAVHVVLQRALGLPTPELPPSSAAARAARREAREAPRRGRLARAARALLRAGSHGLAGAAGRAARDGWPGEPARAAGGLRVGSRAPRGRGGALDGSGAGRPALGLRRFGNVGARTRGGPGDGGIRSGARASPLRRHRRERLHRVPGGARIAAARL